MSELRPTPGQTVGPFFGYALPFPGDEDLVPRSHPRAIRLHGTVFDGAGQPVPDAILELSQADPSGRLVHEPGSLLRDGWTFTGWGRASTDRAGHYSFTTVEPGAAFFGLTVFARGLLDRLSTRVYLPDWYAANGADDAFLAGVDADRRSTLVATRDETGPMPALTFDVHLQGDRETVFLAYPV